MKRIVLSALAVALTGGLAAAQQTGAVQLPTSATGLSTSSRFASSTATESLVASVDGTRIYRLGAAASWSSGCIPPCLCPITFTDDLVGTLNVGRPKVSGNVFEYPVSDVNWLLAGDQLITGSGKWTVIIGFAGYSQQLALNLSIDGAAPVLFDSGLVNGTSFPDLDVTISVGGMVGCFDTWFHVDASPVPKKFLTPYQLVDPSSLQQGCFPPCLCPIQIAQAMKGKMVLVELEDLGTITRHAVVNVDWTAGSDFFPPVAVRGVGIYTRISGIAGWVQRMQMGLSLDGGPVELYDTDDTTGGASFPAIDVSISKNGLFCLDTKIDIHGIPSPSLVASDN